MGEKAILRERTEDLLDTTVKRHEPATIKNPLSEERIGRYRTLEDQICVTADMRLIRECFAKGKEPPSFLEAGPRESIYFNPAEVQVGIVTPGGVAPGLNTVIHSLVSMHREVYGGQRPVYGFLGGFRGLVQQRFMELTPSITREWIHKGGTMLGTSRGEKDIGAMIRSLQDLGVNILYVVGGDGSLTAAHLLAEEVERENLQVRGKKVVVAGIPKTMDNDVLWVWHSFGFDTAVEEATRAINAIHDDTKSTERICLMQLFGRDAGFLAAHASLASGLVDVVLIPESEFHIEPLLDYVEEVLTKKNYAVVVVAEGAAPVEYTEEYIPERLKNEGFDRNDPNYRSHPRVSEALAEGKLTFLKDKFDERFMKGTPGGRRPFRDGRHRVFVSQPRHLIRAVPPNSSDQIHCQRLADLAVHNAIAGFTDFMISQWLTEYVLVPLHLVAKTPDGRRTGKRLPPEGLFWKTVTNNTGQPSFA
ncbi:MAG: ATP-dependent 6-phosphofructokinase [Firmicutes bacterium]|nr:ATP-dependent 6-phosphofructokinase [Bacillota bacterium]